jgi:hypothetical protein
MVQDKTTKDDEQKKVAESSSVQSEKPQDMDINCKTCQKVFTWKTGEQEHYKSKGFTKKPQKCSACREKANKLRDQNMFYVHCALCENDAVFISPPPKDRVAICSQCYNKLVKKYSKS